MEIIYQEGTSVVWKRAQNRSQWNAMDQIIDQWLDIRQELLVHYYSLTKHSPFQNADREIRDNLQTFCVALMDYLAMGHFKVFEQFATIQETYQPTTQLNSELLGAILNTTEKLVDFNDRYSGTFSTDRLSTDLSCIGELLADRLELEDQLMHRYVVATYAMSDKNAPKPMLLGKYGHGPLPAA